MKKKPDGSEVTKDEGETIKVKVNEVKELFKEIKEQKKVVEEKLKNVLDKGGYEKEAGELFQEMSDLETKLGEWQQSPTNKKCKQAYIDASRNFFGIGTASPNWYGELDSGGTNRKGWTKTQEDYIAKQFTPWNSTIILTFIKELYN